MNGGEEECQTNQGESVRKCSPSGEFSVPARQHGPITQYRQVMNLLFESLTNSVLV